RNTVPTTDRQMGNRHCDVDAATKCRRRAIVQQCACVSVLGNTHALATHCGEMRNGWLQSLVNLPETPNAAFARQSNEDSARPPDDRPSRTDRERRTAR